MNREKIDKLKYTIIVVYSKMWNDWEKVNIGSYGKRNEMSKKKAWNRVRERKMLKTAYEFHFYFNQLYQYIQMF